MPLSRAQKYLLTFLIFTLSLGFIVIQLSKFSLDISLNSWEQGAQGYIKASRAQTESGNPIALFFHTDWCANCKEFKERVLATPEIVKYFNNIHPVKVNPELGSLENKLAKEFGVIGYPSFFLVDASTGKTAQIHRTFNVTPGEFIQEVEQATLTLRPQ